MKTDAVLFTRSIEQRFVRKPGGIGAPLGCEAVPGRQVWEQTRVVSGHQWSVPGGREPVLPTPDLPVSTSPEIADSAGRAGKSFFRWKWLPSIAGSASLGKFCNEWHTWKIH